MGLTLALHWAPAEGADGHLNPSDPLRVDSEVRGGAAQAYLWTVETVAAPVTPLALTAPEPAPTGATGPSLRVVAGAVAEDVRVSLRVTGVDGSVVTARLLVPYNTPPEGAPLPPSLAPVCPLPAPPPVSPSRLLRKAVSGGYKPFGGPLGPDRSGWQSRRCVTPKREGPVPDPGPGTRAPGRQGCVGRGGGAERGRQERLGRRVDGVGKTVRSGCQLQVPLGKAVGGKGESVCVCRCGSERASR